MYFYSLDSLLNANRLNIEKNIKLFRLLNGFAIEELQRISNVSHHCFNSQITLVTLKRVANALNVSTKDIILGTFIEDIAS